MSPVRILAAASALELSFAAAATSLAGLGGARNGWLDVINCFAPFTLAAALAGAGLAFLALERGLTRTVTLTVAGVAIAASLVPVAPELANWRPAAHGGGGTFSILDANVWSDNPTPGPAVTAILAQGTDAVMLQEGAGALSGPLQRLRAVYPYVSDCPPSDEQIWVKTPILAQSCGLAPGLNPGLASVTIALPDGRRLTLTTTHLSHPYPPRAQAAERDALAARMRTLGPGDMILAGDFNATPWSFGLKRLDAALAPLRRRTIAWPTWPARLDDAALPWPVPLMPIDQLYASPAWGVARMTLLRLPGSDHFATRTDLVRQPGA
jgi:endonuclease/exonuclease/phosphatase (EEP) superfamily protein YafD